MDAFKRIWQSGFEGQHIEELINGVFGDFAPYAGAEHQRLSFVRQFGTSAATSVTVEETGDMMFSFAHAAAGSTLFTTTGLLQVQANAKVPLPPQNPTVAPTTANGESAASLSRLSSQRDRSAEVSTTRPYNVADVKRFVSTVRGAQLFFGMPAVSRPPPSFPLSSVSASADVDKTFGQVEVDATVPTLWSSRSAFGVRAGPLAARMSRTPTMDEVSVIDASGTSQENSASLQDTSVANKVRQQTTTYTLDASLCVPIAELLQTEEEDGKSGASATSTTAKAKNPLAFTVGLQHPFSSARSVAGDTLIGLAVQNDRSISEAYQACAVDSRWHGQGHSANEAARTRFPSPPVNTFRFLVVQTLLSATDGSGDGSGEGSGLLSGSPSRNTNSRMHNNSGSSNDYTNMGSSTIANGLSRAEAARRGRPWYSLPTLVGCGMSVKEQLLRLSVASIFHDGEVDVEAAAVVDITQLMPQTPTLVKLGWNNTGRLACGVTSFFYNALSVTLGIHATPGEAIRFGLEIKM